MHADHEQNCSSATVRMVGSSGANLFTSLAAGIGALSGPLHGGANAAVMNMLQSIHDEHDDGPRFIEAAQGRSKSTPLKGFGPAPSPPSPPPPPLTHPAPHALLSQP